MQRHFRSTWQHQKVPQITKCQHIQKHKKTTTTKTRGPSTWWFWWWRNQFKVYVIELEAPFNCYLGGDSWRRIATENCIQRCIPPQIFHKTPSKVQQVVVITCKGFQSRPTIFNRFSSGPLSRSPWRWHPKPERRGESLGTDAGGLRSFCDEEQSSAWNLRDVLCQCGQGRVYGDWAIGRIQCVPFAGPFGPDCPTPKL